MNINDYKQAALRTEAKTDSPAVNRELLLCSLELFISSAKILDHIKKYVFYGKPYDSNGLQSAIRAANEVSKVINDFDLSDFDNYEETLQCDSRVLHGIIGVATEAGELAEELYFSDWGDKDGKVKGDRAKQMLDETFDIAWYQSVLIDALGSDWSTGLENNIAKLKVRFPDRFESDLAINKNKDVERDAMK